MPTATDHPAIEAARAIAAYRALARRHATSIGQELELEHAKPAVKHLAIVGLMEQPNPTSAAGKLHSYSSAEQMVELGAGYRGHLTALREATVARYLAAGELRAAELEAMLALTQAATDSLEAAQ
jgi:hypothetical protein